MQMLAICDVPFVDSFTALLVADWFKTDKTTSSLVRERERQKELLLNTDWLRTEEQATVSGRRG